MSDFQRAIVYSWQHDYIMPSYKKGIPLEAVTLLIERVELATACEIPWVINRRATRWAWGGSKITLPNEKSTWAYSVPVVLHECAHVVLKRKGLCDQHGPRFVGAFLQLLRHLGGEIGHTNAAPWALKALDRGLQITSRQLVLNLDSQAFEVGYYHKKED